MGLLIARRFNGPPSSGHGGYSAGLLAERVDAPAVEVALRLPPPLERELGVVARDGALLALDGDAVVLEARATDLDMEARAPVGVDAAAGGVSPWGDRHPFPTCFGCGPGRREGDALRLFAGRVRADGTHAAAWSPAAEFGDPVARRFVWAALDCPTAAPLTEPPPRAPLVLARLAVRQDAPVRAGRPHVVGGWTLSIDGRKRRAAGALWDADGALLAVAETLWIELRPAPG